MSFWNCFFGETQATANDGHNLLKQVLLEEFVEHKLLEVVMDSERRISTAINF